MKAILLAAGYATRLYPLTKNKPKALLEVAGKLLLDYIVEKLEELPDVDEILIVTNARFFSQIGAWLNNRAGKGKKKIKVLNDRTVSNETRLGAIGDINFVIEKCGLDDELLILAADNLFDFSLDEVVDFFRKKQASVVLCHETDSLEIAKSHAVVKIGKSGEIISLKEKPDKPESMLIAKAVYLYPKEVCKLVRQYLEEGNNKDAPGYFVEWLYKRNSVYAFLAEGKIFNIDSIKALREAGEFFRAKPNS